MAGTTAYACAPDVLLHGPRRYPIVVGSVWPPLGEATFYRHVGLWQDGIHRCNARLGISQGGEGKKGRSSPMSRLACRLYGNMPCDFESRSCFWIASRGRLNWKIQGLRSTLALERLYLVAAVALLYGTTQGMAVQVEGLRQQIDPHWHRGLSYLKIGLRWRWRSDPQGTDTADSDPSAPS